MNIRNQLVQYVLSLSTAHAHTWNLGNIVSGPRLPNFKANSMYDACITKYSYNIAHLTFTSREIWEKVAHETNRMQNPAYNDG